MSTFNQSFTAADSRYAAKPLGTAGSGKYVDGGTNAWTALPAGSVSAVKSVKADYNAVGDGTVDDTAALQSAINATLANGFPLQIPPGTYKVTAALVIPASAGWRLFGYDRSNTKIIQVTSGQPILKFTGAQTRSWEIDHISFGYASQQSASTTAILFATGTAGDNIFNWNIHHVYFTNCGRMIAASESATPLLWGVHISDFVFDSTNTGAFFSTGSNPSTGLPNINIENGYGNSGSQSEPAVIIVNGDNVRLGNVEFNGGSFTPSKNQILMTTCAPVLIESCKTEDTQNIDNSRLWAFAQCNVTIVSCSANGVHGTGNPYFILGNVGTQMNVIGMSTYSDVTGGNLIAYYADTIGIATGIKMTGTVIEDARTVVGPSASQPRMKTSAIIQNGTKTRGDESPTLTVNDLRMQYFNTTLTANRTLTLPNSGLIDGMEFEVTRNGGGAYSLTVTDPLTGKAYTLPANTKGFSRWCAVGASEWVIAAAGTYS